MKKIGKPKKKDSRTWEEYMTNRQNVKAPNNVETTEASSKNHAKQQ